MTSEKGTQYYHDKVTALFDGYYSAEEDAKPSAKERNSASNALIDLYVEATGKRPPASVISRLSTYILLDDLTDSHPDKMSREEYPIMSYNQLERHFERTYYLSTLDTTCPNEIIADREFVIFVNDFMKSRDAFIIERYFRDRFTQLELSKELGVSQARVGSIISRVLRNLREEVIA